jgi:hypothetical protein
MLRLLEDTQYALADLFTDATVAPRLAYPQTRMLHVLRLVDSQVSFAPC